ncbi:stalk domain-containing protein [Paenibacillus sp. HB172176]|uniref:stalk domain-containing protein n=1 Tax=Paenibacillus sp. HB172176 TaxID=2493690 RepID=UPI001439DF62|nr:stalk domain-containing protein [Paenibacillus sp. HB172176]
MSRQIRNNATNKFMVAVIALLLSFFMLQPSVSAEPIAAVSGWKSIAAGTTHNLGVKLDGSVWTWGSGAAELFGKTGSYAAQDVPLRIQGLTKIVGVAAGGSHSLALREDGTVWAWGGNTEGELGDGTRSVYDGQTQSYIKNENKSIPFQVKGLEDIVYIAAGFADSYAVKSDGTVWAWGSMISKTPLQLTEYTDVQSISVGYAHIAVLKKDGTVWQRASSLPSYKDGNLQNPGPTTLIKIKNLTNVIAVAAGGGTTHALKEDGSVWGWGYNHAGEIGDGTTIDRNDPVKIVGMEDVDAIAASAGGPFYLKHDGSVWSNGSNLGGQFGIGSYESKIVPTRIEGLVKIKTIASSSTGFRAMAIRQDNTLWSWGNGHVGDGSKWWRTSPVWIKGSPDESIVPIPLTVEINGNPIDFDQQPIVQEGRTLVPLRQIFEALGAEIEWNEATRTINAVKKDTTLKLTLGDSVGYVNGEAIPLHTPAISVNGRTMVPARLASETFGALVGWNPDTRTVTIETKEPESNSDEITDTAIEGAVTVIGVIGGRIAGDDGVTDQESSQQLKPIILKDAQITGKLIDQNNKPVPDVYIIVHGGSKSFDFLQFKTDEEGTYALNGLEENKTYTLDLMKIIYDADVEAKQYYEYQKLTFTYHSSMTTLQDFKITIKDIKLSTH